MKNYSLVSVPADFVNKEFKDFNKKDAEKYLEWFKFLIPSRIEQLTNCIVSEFPEWKNNNTRESLIIVQNWFFNHISYREKTEEEILKDKSQLKGTLLENIVPISNNTLTAKTTSICFDVGVYFAECLKNNNTSLYWNFKLSPKNYIHYGQPVLSSKTSKVDLNPRSIVEMKARKILDNNMVENGNLMKLFDIWDKLLVD